MTVADMKPEPIITTQGSLIELPQGTGENSPGAKLSMQAFVSDLFAAWNKAGITWAVMRNAEGLPDWTRYDIDILVNPDDLTNALKTITGIADEHGWQLIGSIRKRGYSCVMCQSGNENPQYLPFDLMTAVEYRGIRYGNVKDILSSRKLNDEGVWELPLATQTAISILKELLPHSKLKQNARQAVQAATADYPGECADALGSAGCSEEVADQIVSACRSGEWTRLEAISPEIRKCLNTSPLLTLFRRSHAAFSAFSHLFRSNPGIYVVLIGPDGCGKTTIAENVMLQLFKRPFKACRYLHGNFGVLPRFRDLRARAAGIDSSTASLREKELAGEKLVGMVPAVPAWKSFLLVGYYAFDHTLGRLWIRRWRGQWSLIVADRSYYDYYFQLGHTHLPRWILKFFQLPVPKPDLILYLKRDAEEMFRSKPELTVEEIQREQGVIEDLLRDNHRAVTVDGTQGIETATDQACTFIMSTLEQKLPK